MFDLLLALLRVRKAFKNAKKIIQHIDPELVNEIARNALAYGWEIGLGQEMVPVLTSSAGNPFLNPNWRKDAGLDG